MKRTFWRAIGAGLATLALAAGGASASMMTTHVAAKLSGMGEHGTVSLTVNTDARKLCWDFHLPMIKDLTGASIHAGIGGMKLLGLGMRYAMRGCMRESTMTLDHLASTPKKYYVWVDIKGRMGELRGQLHSGM